MAKAVTPSALQAGTRVGHVRHGARDGDARSAPRRVDEAVIQQHYYAMRFRCDAAEPLAFAADLAALARARERANAE